MKLNPVSNHIRKTTCPRLLRDNFLPAYKGVQVVSVGKFKAPFGKNTNTWALKTSSNPQVRNPGETPIFNSQEVPTKICQLFHGLKGRYPDSPTHYQTNNIHNNTNYLRNSFYYSCQATIRFRRLPRRCNTTST